MLTDLALNSVVQLKAVQDVYKATLQTVHWKLDTFPGLFLFSPVLAKIFFWPGKQTAQDRVMLVLFRVSCIFSGKWYPAWRRVRPTANLLGRPLGVREGKMPELVISSFTSSLQKFVCRTGDWVVQNVGIQDCQGKQVEKHFLPPFHYAAPKTWISNHLVAPVNCSHELVVIDHRQSRAS